ncbi:hypothetical protein [Amycolatopsis sp. NPDC004169]|uniref:hypothetical protein n=1 Tax=Amycolatopsis sp. NPDC004169 TaxID=3154453 RepID=UPI00339DF26D
MDEDYARKLRNWLRAEPEATPRVASEEREWLREIPEPATNERPDTPDRWTVRGELPQTPADDDWVCPVIALPVPRPSRENGCRMSGIELRWTPPHRTATPDAARISDAEARSRWNHPTNAARRAQPPDANPMTDADGRSRRNHPTNAARRAGAPDASSRSDADARSCGNTGGRTGPAASPGPEAEARSRWNHPAAPDHPTEPPAAPMSDAEARSRWNHPSSWHRRRRAAQDRPDQPGSH